MRRTVITLVMMGLSVGLMVWMITIGDGIHEEMIRSSLSLGLGSLQVHAAGYQEEKAVGDALLDPGWIYDKASTIPGIEGVSTRLNAFGLASHENESQGAAIIGVEPDGELTISSIGEKIVAGGEWLPMPDETSSDAENYARRLIPAVIGSGMAHKLKVDVGDRVFLTVQGFTRDVGYANCQVVGIFSTGMLELDKNVLYIPIDDLRMVMGADAIVNDDGSFRYGNAVHEVTVLLKQHVDLDSSVEFLKTELGVGDESAIEVMSWEEIQPGLRKFIDLDEMGIYIFMGIVFVIVAVGIMNTFMMSVFERIREFGILMSLGTRPMSIFRLVITESIMIGAIGALAGLVLGLIGAWINYIFPWSMDAYGEMNDVMSIDYSVQIRPWIIWANVLKAVLGIMICTVLAAAWPAWTAKNLRPVEALRHV